MRVKATVNVVTPIGKAKSYVHTSAFLPLLSLKYSVRLVKFGSNLMALIETVLRRSFEARVDSTNINDATINGPCLIRLNYLLY